METKHEINVVNNENPLTIEEDEPINIMDIIENDDRNLLENSRIANMARIDWGKTMAVSNQYIHRNILRYMLSPFKYSVYSVWCSF